MIAPDEITLKEMVRRARAISEKSYSPYSRFPVGAVVLTRDGQMFDGCNVENASYGLTICAERNAVFQMVSRGFREIRALVLFTSTDRPASPCGACRQVIREFGPEAVILSVCNGAEEKRWNLQDLLPDSFGSEILH
ncbi:MAG: cytidine deaminase [Gemmataceae bacterium]